VITLASESKPWRALSKKNRFAPASQTPARTVIASSRPVTIPSRRLLQASGTMPTAAVRREITIGQAPEFDGAWPRQMK